jgi:DNA-binding response OmpR family regulator
MVFAVRVPPADRHVRPRELDMPKILIVDDEEGIRMLYAMELEDEGYEVITLPDGKDLLKVVDKEKPDCIVLDIKMREYSGLDLLQQIRKRHYDMPVILNSAYSSFKVDLKAVAADYYVVKSSDLTELKEKLRVALEARLPPTN